MGSIGVSSLEEHLPATAASLAVARAVVGQQPAGRCQPRDAARQRGGIEQLRDLGGVLTVERQALGEADAQHRALRPQLAGIEQESH